MLNVAAFSCCSSTIFFLPTAVSSKDISISFKLCRRSLFSAFHKSLGVGLGFDSMIRFNFETFVSFRAVAVAAIAVSPPPPPMSPAVTFDVSLTVAVATVSVAVAIS